MYVYYQLQHFLCLSLHLSLPVLKVIFSHQRVLCKKVRLFFTKKVKSNSILNCDTFLGHNLIFATNKDYLLCSKDIKYCPFLQIYVTAHEEFYLSIQYLFGKSRCEFVDKKAHFMVDCILPHSPPPLWLSWYRIFFSSYWKPYKVFYATNLQYIRKILRHQLISHHCGAWFIPGILHTKVNNEQHQTFDLCARQNLNMCV